MSDIHQVIDSLSPDELDLLNSDPEMLSKFKAKYMPPDPSMGDVAREAVKDVVMPPFADPRKYTPENMHEGAKFLPAAGGVLGSVAGGGIPGAALGGAAGEAFKQLLDRANGYDTPQSSADAAKDIGVQGAVQGAAEGVGQAAKPIIGAIAKGGKAAGRQLAQLLEATSGADARNIENLATNPSWILPEWAGGSKSMADASAALNTEKAKIGLDSLSAADVKALRSPARTAEAVMTKMETGEPITLQEAVLGKKALSQMADRTNNSELAGAYKNSLNKIQDVIKEQAPDFKAANQDWHAARTADEFMHVLPQDLTSLKGMLRLGGAGLAGHFTNPVAAAAASPAVVGLGTALTGAAAQAGGAVGDALTQEGINRPLLAALANALTNRTKEAK